MVSSYGSVRTGLVTEITTEAIVKLSGVNHQREKDILEEQRPEQHITQDQSSF